MMKKILKTIGSTCTSIALLVLLLVLLSHKIWSIPILLGLLGLCLFLLSIAKVNKEWKKDTVLGLAGILLMAGAVQLLHENFDAPFWTNPHHLGAFFAILADVVALCTVVVILVFKSMKKK